MPSSPKRALIASTAVAAALIAAVAVPALTTAQAPAARSFVVQEKVTSVVQDDVPPKSKRERVSTGDRLITRQSLFDASRKRIGTLYTDCTNVGPAGAFPRLLLQCLATFKLPAGEIVVSGLARLDAKTGVIPIVGGTGAYEGARGYAGTSKALKGFDSADRITITG